MISSFRSTLIILSKCTHVNDIALATTTSFRRSFMVTSAARVTNSSPNLVATAESIFVLHGAMIMPLCRRLPLLIGAATSRAEYVHVASYLTDDVV